MLFFGVMAVGILGAIKWVSPGLQPVSPALQGWANTIFFASSVGVPTIAIVPQHYCVSATSFLIGRFVELSVAAIYLTARDDLLPQSWEERRWYTVAILVFATVILATSIQSGMCSTKQTSLESARRYSCRAYHGLGILVGDSHLPASF